MPDLDLSSESKALKQALKEVKELYLTLVLKLQDMTDTIKPNLEALYMTKIGVKELELLHLQAEVAGLKYKMELMIASMNKNEPIDLYAIDLLVQKELKQYYANLHQMAEKIDVAQFHLSQLMNAEDSSLLRSLYHALAKRFHPDVNSSLTEEQIKLWNIICEAYSIGDLVTLQNLKLASVEKTEFTDLLSDYDSGIRQLDLLKEKNNDLIQKIEALESDFPFTVKEKLTDEQWIQSEYDTINNRMAVLQQDADKYNDYINLIMEK